MLYNQLIYQILLEHLFYINWTCSFSHDKLLEVIHSQSDNYPTLKDITMETIYELLDTDINVLVGEPSLAFIDYLK